MKTEEILMLLGIKKHQALIYLACLELGNATASQIAKKSGIARPYFYDLAEDIINNGLIFQTVKGKKKYYSALDPEQLKVRELEKLKEIENIIPQLKSIHNSTPNKPKIFFYEGKSGLKEAYNDTLSHDGNICGFTTEKFLLADGKQLSTTYINKRVKAKKIARVIGPMSKELLSLKAKDSNELRQTKMLPRDIFTSDIEIGIYGNKVNFINFNNEFGLVIDNKEIAETMQKIFEIIWKGGLVIE